MTVWELVVGGLLVGWFGNGIASLVWDWVGPLLLNRRRRVDQSSYFDPCGDGCGIRKLRSSSWDLAPGRIDLRYHSNPERPAVSRARGNGRGVGGVGIDS